MYKFLYTLKIDFYGVLHVVCVSWDGEVHVAWNILSDYLNHMVQWREMRLFWASENRRKRLLLSSVQVTVTETTGVHKEPHLWTRVAEEGGWSPKSPAPHCIQGQARVLGDAVSEQQPKEFSINVLIVRQDVEMVIAGEQDLTYLLRYCICI